MPKKRSRATHLRKAERYDLLAQFYKYINPALHIQYYLRHYKHMNTAIQMQRTQQTGLVTEAQLARVRIVHTLTDSPPVDVYLNGRRIMKNAAFKQVGEYIELPPGTIQVDIYPAGTMITNIVSKRVTVAPGKSYILAAGGTLEKPRLFVFEANPFVPLGEAKARFIHLSPDAPNVDIAVPNGDVIFPDLAYKAATEYLGLTPMTVDLEARITGTKEIALALQKIKLRANQSYSIFVAGLAKGDSGLVAIIIKD